METNKGLKKIKELLDAVEGTDIRSVSVEENGLKIGITKMPEAEESGNGKSGAAKKKEKKPREIVEVTSHSVGIFRDSPPPSRKALAKAGQEVNKGQKLGFIESMKILKEIVSPAKGKISKKHIKSGDPIEYGQKLFDIEIV
jgi:acetyl-CoA carboxylase biotin carboxyl carrier protein